MHLTSIILLQLSLSPLLLTLFFFFNDTATTEIYTLSLHDALPISSSASNSRDPPAPGFGSAGLRETRADRRRDRKSTRLNSSHLGISYAVFCLKKKKKSETKKLDAIRNNK